jgi:hypothetical protein
MKSKFDIDYSIKLTQSEIIAIRDLITDLIMEEGISRDDYSDNIQHRLTDVAGEFNYALEIIESMNKAKIKKYNE